MRKFCWVIPALLFLAIGASPARADTITYSYTGTGPYQGTSFTYVSTSGFLTFSTTKLTPTTASDFCDFGCGSDPITGVAFPSSGEIDLYTSSGENLIYTNPYSLDTLGTQTIGGTLTITAAPEPGTLVLLLFGLVALVLVRKRLARGIQPVT